MKSKVCSEKIEKMNMGLQPYRNYHEQAMTYMHSKTFNLDYNKVIQKNYLCTNHVSSIIERTDTTDPIQTLSLKIKNMICSH